MAIWVVNNGSNTVSKIVGTSVTSTITVGSNPWGITSDPSGNIWVANYGSNTVSKIVGTSVTSTIAVGTRPWGITSDQLYSSVTSHNQCMTGGM